MPKKLQTYTVFAKITCEATVDVKAESLEDALAQGQDLKITDFVTATSGGFEDYEAPNIRSVWRND